MKGFILSAVISLSVLFATAYAECTEEGEDCTLPLGQQGVCVRPICVDSPCDLICIGLMTAHFRKRKYTCRSCNHHGKRVLKEYRIRATAMRSPWCGDVGNATFRGCGGGVRGYVSLYCGGGGGGEYASLQCCGGGSYASLNCGGGGGGC